MVAPSGIGRVKEPGRVRFNRCRMAGFAKVIALIPESIGPVIRLANGERNSAKLFLAHGPECGVPVWLHRADPSW